MVVYDVCIMFPRYDGSKSFTVSQPPQLKDLCSIGKEEGEKMIRDEMPGSVKSRL